MLTLAFAQIAWSIALPVGQRHRRLERPRRRLAARPASPSRSHYYLFVLAIVAPALARPAWIAYTPFGYALRAAAIRRCAPKRSASTSAAAGARPSARRRVRRPRGRPLRVLQGQHLAGVAGDSALGRRARHGAAGRPRRSFGPLAGAAAFTWLPDTLSRATDYWRACVGAAILVLVLLAPGGIGGILATWSRRSSRAP